jgi:hypothetical protein
MPMCQGAEIFFTAIIGSFTLALLILSFREDRLRAKDPRP